MAVTYEPIATSAISAGSTIYFSSIASTWTDLKIVATLVNTVSSSSVNIQFNSDAGTNYSRNNIRTGSASVTAQTATGVNDIRGLNWTAVSTFPGLVIFDIFNYKGSTYKTTLITSSGDANGDASSQVNRSVGTWRNTAAITSIDVIFNNSDVSGNVTLYGIKAA